VAECRDRPHRKGRQRENSPPVDTFATTPPPILSPPRRHLSPPRRWSFAARPPATLLNHLLNAMPRILVTPHPLQHCPGTWSETLEAAGLAVVYPPPGVNTFDRATLIALLSEVDGMLASVEPLDREVLTAARPRAIARMGVGYDSIDIAAATELGIPVTITPGALEESVAEHTIALVFAVMRGIVRRDRAARRGDWDRTALPRLAGKTIGLVGLGRIGRVVAQKALCIGLKVIAHDPMPPTEFARERGIRLVALEELLRTADIVSLHSPSTPQTADLIRAETLAIMKRGAVLVNTGRGSLVDEEAVVEALRSGHLLGAALDVFKTEPLPTTSPLMELENVVLCTHMGGLDEQSCEAMANLAASCLADLFQGRWPEPCVVNAGLREGWGWVAK
jgi:D-3-phosphoglycerate dehydrogenase / 2-oxoglutarate reductase